MRMLLVVDGERDGKALAELVGRCLSVKVDPNIVVWKTLPTSRGKGSTLQKRMLFAFEKASDADTQIVVAVVDTDDLKYGEKLRELQVAREIRRSLGRSHQSALGEATPHFDVWLLDDRKALVSAWKVTDSEIADSKNCDYPRDELDKLHENSCMSNVDIAEALVGVARELDPTRCIHRTHNGFAAFAVELEELKKSIA